MQRQDAVIVTGGAGFIGCALSRNLVERGLPVIALDCLLEQVHPSRERPAELHGSVELVEEKVENAQIWDELLQRYRPVLLVHLAAETGTGQSLTESTRHAMVNVVGTTVMLDALRRHDVGPAHIVLTSSRAVYGEGAWIDRDGNTFYPGPRTHAQLAAGQWDHADAQGRPAVPTANAAASVPPNPASIYGSTKLAQELILRNWCASFDTPLSVLRLQNVYGPGQSPHNPYTGIITLFHRLASRGETLDVYEDGAIGRDFVLIDDVVSALSAAINSPPPPAEQRILDVGSGEITTIHDAARLIAESYGAPPPVVSGRFRDGDVRSAYADIRPTIPALGWEPVHKFREGSLAVSEWLRAGGFLG